MAEVELPVIIRFGGRLFLDDKKAELLRLVQSSGSLHAATRILSVSYQTAWTTIETINKIAPKPLVVKQRGGAGGGGAILSEYGTLILHEYDLIRKQVLRFTEQLNHEINL